MAEDAKEQIEIILELLKNTLKWSLYRDIRKEKENNFF